MSEWIKIGVSRPPCGEEVLVWVDGHRGPGWRNNHALVAYLGSDGQFWEERHAQEPLWGVILWREISEPTGTA